MWLKNLPRIWQNFVINLKEYNGQLKLDTLLICYTAPINLIFHFFPVHFPSFCFAFSLKILGTRVLLHPAVRYQHLPKPSDAIIYPDYFCWIQPIEKVWGWMLTGLYDMKIYINNIPRPKLTNGKTIKMTSTQLAVTVER